MTEPYIRWMLLETPVSGVAVDSTASPHTGPHLEGGAVGERNLELRGVYLEQGRRDAIYQLLQVTQGVNTTESYSGVYPERSRGNPVGNRLSSLGVSPYTYNPSNELASTPTAMYVYDANGNAITKTDSTGTTNYTWDFENRLIQVTLPGTGGTVSFKYDPFGRRIYKSSSAGTSIFAYDAPLASRTNLRGGDNLVEEVNASGAVVARYTQGQNIDEPLAMSRSGATSYYEADGLGSVTSLTSSAGALAETYTFDSFGKLTNSAGSLTNPFRYTARELDPETGLYYYRARYYDVAVGRFVSEDPARFVGGFNFYTYVKNGPVDFIDPYGLKCWQSSPWVQIPGMWGAGGPSPYLTIESGVFWVSTGWSYFEPGSTTCICTWIATHTRLRKFYREKVMEQAQFTCDCPNRAYYKTRERTHEWEVDSPGKEFWPSQETETFGATFQLGTNVGALPEFKSTVECSCLLTPPVP